MLAQGAAGIARSQRRKWLHSRSRLRASSLRLVRRRRNHLRAFGVSARSEMACVCCRRTWRGGGNKIKKNARGMAWRLSKSLVARQNQSGLHGPGRQGSGGMASPSLEAARIGENGGGPPAASKIIVATSRRNVAVVPTSSSEIYRRHSAKCTTLSRWPRHGKNEGNLHHQAIGERALAGKKRRRREVADAVIK